MGVPEYLIGYSSSKPIPVQSHSTTRTRAARAEAEAALLCQLPAPTPSISGKAPKLGPRDKYSTPLTAQQEIGWEASQVKPVGPAAGRKSSEETKHVGALLQQGYYF